MTKLGDAYRWFHGRMMDRPTNFSWVVEGKLAGCGLPMTEDEFEWLVDQGIKSVVTVREVALPSDWFEGSDIDYMHLQVEDFGAPTIEELDQAVDFIDRQIGNGRAAMVHCAAGKGRTGAVIAAYLSKAEPYRKQALQIAGLRPARPSVSQETGVDVRTIN